MRFVARLKNLEEISTLINLGVDVFSVDTPLTVKRINEKLFENLSEIKKIGKQVYLLINKIIHEQDLKTLRSILEKAKTCDIDGLVVADISVMIVAKDYGLESKIIYQPGTMNTNSFDNQYFSLKEIKGITLSKEITLEEVEVICENKKTELSIIGHGYLDMFYSKRKLLTNYFKFKGIEKANVKDNPDFRLEEEMRPDSDYPILEDDFGTHIFRDKALESFSELEYFTMNLDDFFIERIFLNDEEYYDSIKAYQTIESQKDFLLKYQENYNKGFYYTATEKTKGDRNEN